MALKIITSRIFVVFLVIMKFSQISFGYIGVERLKNGTDIEIRTLKTTGSTKQCGDSVLLGHTHIEIDANRCGYICGDDETSYSLKTSAGALSCRRNEDIMQEESKRLIYGIKSVSMSEGYLGYFVFMVHVKI